MHHYNSILLLQTVNITIYRVTIQSCSGAWVQLTIILVTVSCTGLSLHFFIPVQPTCSCTFYTCSIPYLFTFAGKFFMLQKCI